jgi:hypothetical protein
MRTFDTWRGANAAVTLRRADVALNTNAVKARRLATEATKPTTCAHCERPALCLDWRKGTKGWIGLCRDHRHLFRGDR